MGSRWEVWAYLPREGGGYEYVAVYASQRLLPTVVAAYRAKRDGAGCVKVEWR